MSMVPYGTRLPVPLGGLPAPYGGGALDAPFYLGGSIRTPGFGGGSAYGVGAGYAPTFGRGGTGLPGWLAGQTGPVNVSNLYAGGAGGGGGIPPGGGGGSYFPPPPPRSPGGPIPSGVAADVSELYGSSGAAGGGRLAGLGSALAASKANAGPISRFLGGGGIEGLTGTKALLARGAGASVLPLAGHFAAAGISNILPSTGTKGDVRQVLADSLELAGLGAGIGMAAGGPLGAAIGGGAGALVGGGYALGDIIFGEKEGADADELRGMLETSAKALGVGPSLYTTAFDTAVKTGMVNPQTGEKMDNKQIAAMLATKMQDEVVTNRQTAEQSATQKAMHEADLQYSLAMQTKAAETFSPYANNIVAAGASQAKMLNSLAEQVPEAYKGVFQAQATSALNNTQQMAGAYMSQMAMMPTMQILSMQDQARQKEMSDLAQIYQSAMQLKSQSGAGGGTDFSQLLTQTGA